MRKYTEYILIVFGICRYYFNISWYLQKFIFIFLNNHILHNIFLQIKPNLLKSSNIIPSTMKELTLTWRNISYKIEKRNNGSYLKSFFGTKSHELVQVLDGGN